ncbi:DUF2290 domain-containing protein [Methanogenium marinum]|uniref:DUF2290 domain-containing protein n=1 Tax=Methanogenium marinum TaxID=348610 RepID=A0A9Q4PV29_9EURY|nr:DUF2290 domain-containing protein [Methanogenium marinum]MDE4907164.1 DUF2290 domain-containing protein [Methanogenium marinum]
MNVSEVMSSLVATYNEWSNILVNTQYIRENNSITWRNHTPLMLPYIMHKNDLDLLEVKKQYTFQIIEDGSFIQIFYKFEKDNSTLIEARLAYYGNTPIPRSGDEWDQDGEDLELTFTHDTIMDELIDSDTFSQNSFYHDDFIVPWLRIDFSNEETECPLHHSCHMHIGLFGDARIPLTVVPSPRQFIEFIIAHFYPREYHLMRLDQDGKPKNKGQLRKINNPSFQKIISDNYDYLPHLNIPIY